MSSYNHYYNRNQQQYPIQPVDSTRTDRNANPHQTTPSYEHQQSQHTYGSSWHVPARNDGSAMAADTSTSMHSRPASQPRVASPVGGVAHHYGSFSTAPSDYPAAYATVRSPHLVGPSGVSVGQSYGYHQPGNASVSEPVHKYSTSSSAMSNQSHQHLHPSQSAPTNREVSRQATEHNYQQQSTAVAPQMPYSYGNGLPATASQDRRERNASIPTAGFQSRTDTPAAAASHNSGTNYPNATVSPAAMPTAAASHHPGTNYSNATVNPGAIPTATASHNSGTNYPNTTVDPAALYNRWPEYQHKLSDAQAAQPTQAAPTTMTTQVQPHGIQSQASATNGSLPAKHASNQIKNDAKPKRKEPTAKKNSEASATPQQRAMPATNTTPGSSRAQDEGKTQREVRLREMMALIRQLNEEDPELVAQVWEEERKEHGQKTNTPKQSPSLRPVTGNRQSTPKTTAHPQPAPSNTSVSSVGVMSSEASQPTPIAGKSAARKASKEAAPKVPAAKAAAARATAAKATPGKSVAASTSALAVQLPQQPTATATTQPTQRPMGNTHWPAEKRGKLASAAAKWVNESPLNSARQVHPVEIEQILKDNPSYIELCERIELMGIKVERGSFARALLQAVPDVNHAPVTKTQAFNHEKHLPHPHSSDSALPPPAAKQPAAAHQQRIPRLFSPTLSGYSQIARSSAANLPHQREEDVTPGTFESNQSPPLPTVNAPSSVNTVEYHIPTKTASPAAVVPGFGSQRREIEPNAAAAHATKEEAARKRKFSELIDLTAKSDSEDEVLPMRSLGGFAYQQGPVNGSGFPSHQLTAYQLPPKLANSHNIHHVLNGVDGVGSEPHRPYMVLKSNGSMPAMASTAEDKFKLLEIAQVVDRKNALRRSAYNIRTIARDVLLATGRHSDMLPLNAHLDCLKIAFPRKVVETTDLATLHWDLIDPGEAIPAFRDDDDKDSVIADDADDEEEIEYASPATFITSRIRVSSHGVAIADAGEAFTGISTPNGRAMLKKGLAVRHYTPNQPRRASQGPRVQTLGRTTDPVSAGAFGARSVPNSNSTPSASGRPTSYAEYRAAMEAAGTPVPRGRGRPVGWRKNPSDMAAPGQLPQRKHGKQPSTAAPSPSLPEQANPTFECLWDGCHSQLHNLETLKKHIRKIHGKQDASGSWKCTWSDCGKSAKKPSKESGQVENHWLARHQFGDFKAWDYHVQSTHIGPVAWKYGDGPAGGFMSGKSSRFVHCSETSTFWLTDPDATGTDSDAYLSDTKGRRVTPRIQVPIEPTDPNASIPARVPRPRESPEDKARESFDAMVRKKKTVGPGMDRAGSRMVTDQMRAGFMDDEDFEKVLDEENDEE